MLLSMLLSLFLSSLGCLMLQGLSTFPVGRTAGGAVVTTVFSHKGRREGKCGSWLCEGKWRTWTVCLWGEHHIQHAHNCLSPSPPLHLPLLLSGDVSWSCWQQWRVQHRDNRGEGTGAAPAGRYICLDPHTAVWPQEIIAGNTCHVWEFFTIWNGLTAPSRSERSMLLPQEMMTSFGRLPLWRWQGIFFKHDWLMRHTVFTGIPCCIHHWRLLCWSSVCW